MTEIFKSRLDLNSDNYEKEYLQKKIIEEGKKELSEFDYLKLCGYEYDKFKHKLDELNISPKQKELIIKITNNYVYKIDNDSDKLKMLKELNNLVDKIKEGKTNTQQIINELKEKYADHPILSTIIGTLATIIIGIIVTGSAGEFAIFMTLAVSITIASAYLAKHKVEDRIETNELFDVINDIYPDITEKEFEQLKKDFDKGNLDIDKLSKILNKYYEDGKITPEEHKKILQYLKSIS